MKTFAELATPVTTASGSTRLTDMLAAQPVCNTIVGERYSTIDFYLLTDS